MFRKILVIVGFVVVCALFSGYFYCADRYARQQTAGVRCDKIDVVITNSNAQDFISKEEVTEMVRSAAIGKKMDEINIHGLEQRLCASSAICKAEAYLRMPSTLSLEVTQHYISRIERLLSLLSSEEQEVLERMIINPYPEVVFDLTTEMKCETTRIYRIRSRALDKLVRLRYGAGA